MLGKQLIQAAAGAAGAAGGALYVDDVFSTFLAVGAGGQTITNGIDLATEGGMVWSKARAVGAGFGLHDTERGINKFLSTSSNNPQTDVNSNTNFHTINSFNTDGFTTGADGGYGVVDNNGYGNYVHWSFRKAPGFFDVCEWTGNSVSGRQIAHNLGSAPGFIMVKSYVAGTGGTGWMCYHRSLGNTKAIRMDTTSAATSASSAYWNNTDPTSTHFTVGNHEDINTTANSRSYVAYVFAHDDQSFGTNSDEAVIKCGSFNIDSLYRIDPVDLDFEPQFLILKVSSANASWHIYDTMRGLPTKGGQPLVQLLADAVNAETTESTGNNTVSITSTGFTEGSGYGPLSANSTGVYVAIRRPNKPPTAGTEVFKAITRNGTQTDASITGFGFVPDLFMSRARNNIADNTFQTYDRLRGPLLQLSTISTAAESSYPRSVTSFDQDGVSFGNDTHAGGVNYTGGQYVYHTFSRAPGFFDVVAYSGTGVNNAVNHNLGATPEFVIIKDRLGSTTNDWICWHKDLTSTDPYIFLKSAGEGPYGVPWIAPSSTALNLSYTNFINVASNSYIAYLFATLPGISKVGSYTGTGNAINVDCGFSSGARFILIKRTDSTGDWFVYDTARGIVSGDDPYLLLNSSAAEVTNTDYIDPLSSGFTVTSSAPTGLNASGGSYIYLSVA